MAQIAPSSNTTVLERSDAVINDTRNKNENDSVKCVKDEVYNQNIIKVAPFSNKGKRTGNDVGDSPVGERPHIGPMHINLASTPHLLDIDVAPKAFMFHCSTTYTVYCSLLTRPPLVCAGGKNKHIP